MVRWRNCCLPTFVCFSYGVGRTTSLFSFLFFFACFFRVWGWKSSSESGGKFCGFAASKFLATIRSSLLSQKYTMPVVDLLNPTAASEATTHKLKRLVQAPNSYFMDVKCPGCMHISTVFSHAQTVIQCTSCMIMLAQPTGGKARLTEGCSFRKKADY